MRRYGVGFGFGLLDSSFRHGDAARQRNTTVTATTALLAAPSQILSSLTATERAKPVLPY